MGDPLQTTVGQRWSLGNWGHWSPLMMDSMSESASYIFPRYESRFRGIYTIFSHMFSQHTPRCGMEHKKCVLCRERKQVTWNLCGWKVKKLRITGSKLSMISGVKTCCFSTPVSTHLRNVWLLSETCQNIGNASKKLNLLCALAFETDVLIKLLLVGFFFPQPLDQRLELE